MKILVIGLGNPILGDDGVGWHITKKVEGFFYDNPPQSQHNLSFIYVSLGGLRLMELMENYDMAIIIDAILSEDQPLGSIQKGNIEDLPITAKSHIVSSHDTSLLTAIELGRNLGLKLPIHIKYIGVIIQPTYTFSEKLTPNIESSLDLGITETINTVYELLNYGL